VHVLASGRYIFPLLSDAIADFGPKNELERETLSEFIPPLADVLIQVVANEVPATSTNSQLFQFKKANKDASTNLVSYRSKDFRIFQRIHSH
jgi:hypothetical protein